jgi:hypothetical protein
VPTLPDQAKRLNELMTREEGLHPDLSEYLVQVPMLGTCLQHPLVYAVPYIPTNAFYNEQYRHKREAVAQYAKEEKWGQLIFMYERPYRMQQFLEIAGLIENHEEYWELLGDILTDTENMHQWQDDLYCAVEPENSDRREARYNIMSKSELWALSQLQDQVVVYRGCTEDNECGWCWSVRREIARGFATRFDQDGYIIKATVRKRDIIAYFDRRNEFEVFIDPDYVDWEMDDPNAPDEITLD